ncbi:MAG: NAD(P)/FAD-dependent oxidoreductase [Alkalispirochaeta sp.]
MNRHSIVVIGGGFAGTQAVEAIRRADGAATIHLIDRTGLATMLPALPDLMSGRIRRAALARPLQEIFQDSVDLVTDEVRGIDPEAREVTTTRRTFHYDVAVIAAGSVPVPPPGVLSGFPIHTVHDLRSASALRKRISDDLAQGARPHVLIVGAGYTGLETAAAIRGGTRQRPAPAVTVVDAAPEILPMLTPKIRDKMVAHLTARGIDVRVGTAIADASDHTVRLTNGTEIVDPIICWSAGMRASPIELPQDLRRTRDGRLITNEFLQIPEYPSLFAAGDAAALVRGDTHLRRAVNFSYYSGRRAGRNAVAHVSGRALKRFRPVDLGWVIPLGTVSSGRIFGGIRVGGKPGLRMHYFMSGFRHFGGGRSWEFYATALNLRRRPEPLDDPEVRDAPDVGEAVP